MITIDKAKFQKHFLEFRKSEETRLNCKFTIQNIADKIGMTRQTLTRAVQTGIIPDLLTFASICRWMNRTVDEYVL